MYLSQQTYYRVSALDNRLGGAEQRLTDDLSELAGSVAHLYSSLTKPLLDCGLVAIALVSFSSRMGARTIPGNINYYQFFFYNLHILNYILINKKKSYIPIFYHSNRALCHIQYLIYICFILVFFFFIRIQG